MSRDCEVNARMLLVLSHRRTKQDPSKAVPQSLSAAMMDRELQHVDVIIEAVKDQSRERSVEKLTIEINAGPSVARVSGQVSRVDEPRSSLDEGNTVEGRKEGRKWPHHRKSDLLSSDRR